MVRCICRDTTALNFKRVRPRPSRRAIRLPSHSLHFTSTTSAFPLLSSLVLSSPCPSSGHCAFFCDDCFHFFFSSFSFSSFLSFLLILGLHWHRDFLLSRAGQRWYRVNRWRVEVGKFLAGKAGDFGVPLIEIESHRCLSLRGNLHPQKRPRSIGTRMFAIGAEA